MKRPRVARKAQVTKDPCACCGALAILTLTASAGDGTAPNGAPVTLCAECIIAFAQALADQR